MNKRSLVIFLILLILVLFILQDIFFIDKLVSVLSCHVDIPINISQSILSQFYSSDAHEKKEGSKQIIEKTLINLGYDNWLPYLEYIDISIFQSNIMPDNAEELIVALNLSKDQAVIAIYTQTGQEYVYANKIENLLPIQDIQFMKNPETNYNFIITTQLLDERLGGFFIEKFIEIYYFVQDNFQSVWKKNKYSEEIFNLQWQDPTASPNHWRKIIESNMIEFKHTETPSISVNIHRQFLKAIHQGFPSIKDFSLESELRYQEAFHWSPKYNHFIMKEAVHRETEETFGIIEDTSGWVEHILGFSSNNYIVISSEGTIRYVSKDTLIITDK
ncbi:MAG: hypothetical protein ACOYVK_04870 [Bacillota bacterium]